MPLEGPPPKPKNEPGGRIDRELPGHVEPHPTRPNPKPQEGKREPDYRRSNLEEEIGSSGEEGDYRPDEEKGEAGEGY